MADTKMRSRPTHALRGILTLVLCSLAATGHALEGDRIRPSVGLSYTYSDNIYYLDDRVDTSSFAFIRDGKKGDQTIGLRAGLDIDHYVSRQVFSLRSQITNNRHVTYDNLDYTTYNLRGEWKWVVGERWDGTVGYDKERVASSFYDFRAADRTSRNLRTRDSFFASGMMRMSPDWKLRGALRYNSTANSLARFNSTNVDEWVAEAGSRRYSKGTDDFVGLNLRYADGRFPNRQVVSTSTVDNAYRQYTVEGVIDYQYSGLTRISGNLGLTARQHKQLSQRNFTGLTGRLEATYALSSKTSLNGAVFREIGAWQDFTTNYVVTQGFTAGATQTLTEKLLVQANYSLRRRSFEGDPDFIVLSLPTRKDMLQSYTLSLVWTPLRNVRFDGSASYTVRDTNDAWAANGFGSFNDFAALILYLSGQVTF